MSKSKQAGKEFALGALTTMPLAAWDSPEAGARMMVDAVKKASEQFGGAVTADNVRGLAGYQLAIVAELHRIADEMDGVERADGPQLVKVGMSAGLAQAAPPPLPPCPICKKATSADDGQGFLMIHAACAPKEQP